MNKWTFNKLDQRLANDLRQALPPAVFDIHAHLWRTADLPCPETGLWHEGPAEVTPTVWREQIERQIGCERLAGALFIPVPVVAREQIPAVNAWVMQTAASVSGGKALALVTPEMTSADVATLTEYGHFAGFKPYHTYSNIKPTFQAPLSSFLPEWTWAFANERGLVIMLHLVRDAALADAENQRELRYFCRRYPNARLILAHAARGFHAPNTVKGITALRGLDNVWFDTSGICETSALQAILHEFGPRRLMWGSDFPISEIRGRCVTVGDGFAWLKPDTVRWDQAGLQGGLTLVGLESLRALQTTVELLNLNAIDRQDVYADNARRIFGFASKTGGKT